MAAKWTKVAIRALLLSGGIGVSLGAQNASSVAVASASENLSPTAKESAKAAKTMPQDTLPKGSALRYHVKMRMRGEDAILLFF